MSERNWKAFYVVQQSHKNDAPWAIDGVSMIGKKGAAGSRKEEKEQVQVIQARFVKSWHSTLMRALLAGQAIY